MRTLLVVVVALALAAPVYAGLSMGDSPDVTVLVKQGLTKLHAMAQFKKAVLLEADGTPKNGKTTTAAGITKWRLVYQNQTTPGSKYATAIIRVQNGKLGNVVGVKSPFLEDRNIATVPKMTLTKAVAKLRAAGHRQAFVNVTLRWPLGPTKGEPLYIFGYQGNKYWAVGTRSGKVKPLS